MTSLEVLEFSRVAAGIAAYAMTEDGRELVSSLTPLSDRDELTREKGYVRKVLAMLERGIPAPTGEVLPLEGLFDAVEREGADLDGESLLEIRRFLDYAASVIGFVGGDEDELLRPLHDDVAVPKELHRELTRLITPDGSVNEDAIPEIRRYKEELARITQTLIRRAEGLIREAPTMYHGDQPTVRDGRTVIPLAANFKGRIDGIVHESSGSGETLFVEPRDLVDLNNELTQTSYAVHREIRRVLTRLSGVVRSLLPELRDLYGRVVRIDTIVARARWGYDNDGSLVEIGTNLDLRNGRHPLLGRSCVPLSIQFDEDVRLLVISGPNTGGKTVLIKTIGLLTVLHQCAVPIPADPDSTLPLYTHWGVDIGDEQSIDEHLSTFSAHMRRIAQIVNEAGPASLVLLDELGTGTDPDEGGALSLAIVDELVARGSTVLVSTHQTVLKHYGYSRAAARNVSMDFDQTTHRPTYRIVPGRPGSSHAIDTAAEQGLDRGIITAARDYASDRHNNVAEIIARLLEQEEHLRSAREEVENERRAMERRYTEVRTREEELNEREREIRQGYIRELDVVIRESRKAVEGEIRNIRERGDSLEKETIRSAHDQIRDLESLREELSEGVRESEGAQTASNNDDSSPGILQPGTAVTHVRTGKEGVVKSVEGAGKKRKVLVQFGALRMTLSPADLRRSRTEQRPVRYQTQIGRSSAVLELDIRGMRLREALAMLETQVDGAVLSGLRHFSIIHGTGTGVLQKGVHDYLKGRSEVTSYSFARPEEGGFGKTTVELSSASR